jgi:predicted pyridoxine 5'-phosphate oxidase superfamily flavin-nucleotide-binding protein
MTKFTQNMRDAAANTPVFIMATASKDGEPNGVPMGLARIFSDDEILIVDNFMNKTRQNLAENPRVAVSFWSAKTHGGGYQCKGTAQVLTSGAKFDTAMEWVKSRKPPHTPKAMVFVKVDAVYHVGARNDSDINLAEAPE